MRRPQLVKIFRGVKSIICITFAYKRFCILPVIFLFVALPVRPKWSPLPYAFVNLNSAPFKRLHYILLCSLNKTGLIGILDPENKGSAKLPGKQVVIEGSPY